LANRKINIVTLGCSKNLVDSEKLLKQIEAGGFAVSHNLSDSDASTVIVNTCGFINDAKEESIDTILSLVKRQQTGKIENLYVMGCLAERYMHQLKEEIPEVNRYFGVNNFNGILSELGILYNRDYQTQRILTSPGHFAYLKISEGCDRTCAFCAIPSIRGKAVSRPVGELIEEAVKLSEAGVSELILIAQDLSYYGIDLYKSRKLPLLVSELASLNLFKWIRLHYLYPANFPTDLIKVINDNEAVCKYIDIPVQHISDGVLIAMKRSHNRRETEKILHQLRKEIPGAAIRTTLISGHPGEGLAEHTELLNFVEEFRFDRLGVFAYSHEEGTWAGNNYADEVPQNEKERRVAEIMSVQQDISAENNNSLVGKTLEVIIDREDSEYIAGRTRFDSPEVDQEVLIPKSFQLKPGTFINAKITQSSDFDLFGEPVS
jgi:ribosomal protein S12 methylthiotransferase